MEPSTACEWNSATLLVVSENVGPLIYYSHLLPLIASIVVGVFVISSSKRTLVHWVLAFITFMFSAWVYFDLILWASPSPEYVMFFWSSIVPIEMLIYASCLYLVYLFSNGQKDIPLRTKIAIGLFFVPIVLFTHTGYNVLGLSPDCDEGAIEGPLIQYMYIVEILYILWAAVVASTAFRKITDKQQRSQLTVIALGTIAFLISFTIGNITLIFSVNPLYEQYKLFGMPLFAAFVTYSIIRFHTFNARVFTAQALVIALATLVFSLLFVEDIQSVRIITAITFALVCAIGFILIRNVRREIRQREIIEVQAHYLENLNHQQEGLLAFISHEVKGYLAKGQGAFSGILEGDYGPIQEPLRKMADAALIDARKGVDMVGDILDASNLRRGTVSYVHKPFDFKKSVEEIIHDLRPSAEAKGISLDLSCSAGEYTIEGDEAKLRRHVIRNLIDNSIHYTLQGSIHVSLSRGHDRLHFSVKDTGVGLTKEDMEHLFTEGGKGKDSIKVNVDSTGYGLFIAKQITEAHHGKIWAQSKGKGEGSEFIVELPIK